jgi:hypothetical protein
MNEVRAFENVPKFTASDALKNAIEKVCKDNTSNTWTPATVIGFNQQKRIVKVREFFPMKKNDKAASFDSSLSGDLSFAQYEVPLLTPSSGSFEFSFPLHEGDTVIVLFSADCIENWRNGTKERVSDLKSPTNAVAIPCLFNKQQSQAREKFFLQNGANLNPENVHLMYQSSHIEFTKDSDILNIFSRQLNIDTVSKVQIKANSVDVESSNFRISDTVKLATTQNYSVLLNILNQLKIITNVLNTLPYLPLTNTNIITTPIDSQLLSLQSLVSQLQQVVE